MESYRQWKRKEGNKEKKTTRENNMKCFRTSIRETERECEDGGKTESVRWLLRVLMSVLCFSEPTTP
jgi:hypothetical protein